MTATQTKKANMNARIKAHCEKLIELFHLPRGTDPVTLCKRLRALEARAQAMALRLCNGPEYPTEDAADKIADAILSRVNKLLNNQGCAVPIFINRDPRGYALKIDDGFMNANGGAGLQRDWGGYGIIAPDLTKGD